MASNNIYHGQAAFEPGLDVKPHTYDAKPFDEEYDVEIKVTHCGICGSDLHTISGGWGEIKYPLVVGHEIVGHVVRLGSKVDATKYAIGTRVGVGAQCGSCLNCNLCHQHYEQVCGESLLTYNGPTVDGYITQGGYADYYRCNAHFVIPIPDELPSEIAAPMMCGGITTYSPLKTHGAGPGKKVGIIGIGGLGHLGIQWAVALGAEVTAISSSNRKEKLCKEQLGAHHFLNTNDPDA
ncbi:NADP-dependent alcohol dehydrogenase 6, partial [Thraustotheca clavata]